MKPYAREAFDRSSARGVCLEILLRLGLVERFIDAVEWSFLAQAPLAEVATDIAFRALEAGRPDLAEVAALLAVSASGGGAPALREATRRLWLPGKAVAA